MMTGEMGSAKAPVFNMVRGSFVDGYGVRTTIFLKGCPLKCAWCCNPEGQKLSPQLRFQKEHCECDGKCVNSCKKGALSYKEGTLLIDREICDGCGDCVEDCWYGALEIFGKEMTAQEVFSEIKKDKPFFEESGGGLTIGGGEATVYPAFCNELIRLCHAEGIRVAIDTCGYIFKEESMEVLKNADLILFDIKGLDESRHIANTGVSNVQILRNLKTLDEWKKSVIIRYPAIPGYNLDEAEQIADFLTQFQCVERVDIIAYHKFGSSKYEEIGMKYGVQSEPLSEQEKEELLQIFQEKNLPAQLGG
jgi:pyruvate formate lyase activating enzyme